MLKSQARAAEYRAKALNETRHAQASGLVLVREKHELAASVWRDLASQEDRRSAIAHPRRKPGALPDDVLLSFGFIPANRTP